MMFFVSKARTHAENRAVLCGVCYKKGVLRPITETQLTNLQTLLDRSYDLNNERYQTVLCKICSQALSAHVKNPEKPGRTLMKPKYDNLIQAPLHGTRSFDPQDCPCTVCQIAKSNLTPGGSSGHRLEEKFWKILFPDLEYPKPKHVGIQVTSRCTSCRSIVGKGKSHKCTKTKNQDNLHKLVKQSSLKSKEKVGSNILKTIFEEKITSTRGGTVQLTTGIFLVAVMAQHVF